MAVGRVRSVTIDVNDLEVGEHFWAALTGLPVTLRGWNGQYSRLGTAGEGSVLLQLVPEEKGDTKNRVHVDLTVDDLDEAVAAVLTLGGSLDHDRRAFPESGAPARQYAVMKDPFGNEFCVVQELLPDSHGDVQQRSRRAATQR